MLIETTCFFAEIDDRVVFSGCLCHFNVFDLVLGLLLLLSLLIIKREINTGFLLSQAWLISDVGCVLERNLNGLEEDPGDFRAVIHH